MVYGLSVLERFRGMGWARIYLIFGLTDEAYALYVGAEPGKGENEKTLSLIHIFSRANSPMVTYSAPSITSMLLRLDIINTPRLNA